MNIKNVVDGILEYRNKHPNITDEELKLHMCERFLSEIKNATAEEFLPHLRSVDLKKEERQIVVTLTFPWEITVSNFL